MDEIPLFLLLIRRGSLESSEFGPWHSNSSQVSSNRRDFTLTEIIMWQVTTKIRLIFWITWTECTEMWLAQMFGKHVTLRFRLSRRRLECTCMYAISKLNYIFFLFRASRQGSPAYKTFTNSSPSTFPPALRPTQTRPADTPTALTHGGQALSSQRQAQHLRRRL